MAHLYCSAAEPFLVAERLRESESVRYTVTGYANVRADLYRTIMRIKPEYYALLCVHWRCRGLSSTFCHLCLPHTGLGGSTLTRCRGTRVKDGGAVLMVGKHLIG